MSTMKNIEKAVNAQTGYYNIIRESLIPLPGGVAKALTSPDGRRYTLEFHRQIMDTSFKALPISPHLNVTTMLTSMVYNAGGATYDGISAQCIPSVDWAQQDTGLVRTDLLRSVSYMILEADVLRSELLYTPSDIIDLLTTAAATMEPEAIHHEDLISPTGFCYLEKPFVVNTYHPDTGEASDIKVGYRAFSWRRVLIDEETATPVDAVQFTLYTDRGCYRDIYLPTLHAATGESYETYVTEVSKLITSNDDAISIQDITFWHFGTPWNGTNPATSAGDILANKGISPAIQQFRTFFLAMMRFCWQELLVTEPAEVSRHARRRSLRSVGRDIKFTVLKLRRSRRSGDGETGTGSRLDHRLLVRGHWRNQHYPSLGAPRTDDGAYNALSHRRIWIDPHVKGPEDAPFVNRHKVIKLG